MQFYNKASQEISNIDDKISKGDMNDLLKWLRKNIHVHGKRYDAKDLCKNYWRRIKFQVFYELC